MQKYFLSFFCVFLLSASALVDSAHRPTTNPGTSAPTSSSGCSGKVKIMVPLYVYPGSAWEAVASGASSVSTVAIINPNSGPANPPNSDYVSYMQKLHNAGVQMIGYVYTSYGTRATSAVEADITIYANQYPLLSGIFLDEGSADASLVSYYQTLHNYILSKPGWTINVINPGVAPTSGYLAASTQLVTLEDYGTAVAGAVVPSYVQCSNKGQFVAIIHDVSSSSMPSIVNSLLSKNYFGYIYVTDGEGGCCTYNSLTSYYASLVSYVASKQ